jgi:LPS-assembly protein
VDARGNAVLVSGETLMRGERIQFDLDTRVGTIDKGQISNGLYKLMGERIHRKGPGQFHTAEAEYTTCHDCPESWSFVGTDVDIEFGGYAFMKDVKMKVKSAPFFWLPYLVIPLKTQRQTGLLFPRFAQNARNGTVFVQPFFLTLGRSADMTFGAGTYSERGLRLEWEGRYALADRSKGGLKTFFVNDSKPDAPIKKRWGFAALASQELGWDWHSRLRWYNISDNLAPIHFSEDTPGFGEPALGSDLTLFQTSRIGSASVEARWYRNLFALTPTRTLLHEFDPNMVQVVPRASFYSQNFSLFKSRTFAGFRFEASRFVRGSDPFDYLPDRTGAPITRPFDPTQDILREGTRMIFAPSIYTTLRPLPWLSVVPSAEFRGYYYAFPAAGTVPVDPLFRNYLLTQVEASMQLEKIYTLDSQYYSKIKHTLRPSLQYSLIPYLSEDSTHPFVHQISNPDRGRIEYAFDTQDIVPLDTGPQVTNAFTPLGHSLTYGLSSNLVRKEAFGNGDYHRFFDVFVGQSFDIREYRKLPERRKPWAPFRLAMSGNHLNNVYASVKYDYFPDVRRYAGGDQEGVRPHRWQVGSGWVFERSTRYGILAYERSVNLDYYSSALPGSFLSQVTARFVFSINDYLMPTFFTTLNLDPKPIRTDPVTGSLVPAIPLFQDIRLDVGASESPLDLIRCKNSPSHSR